MNDEWRRQAENVYLAVAIMTAWLEQNSGAETGVGLIPDLVDQYEAEGQLLDAMGGLITLSGALLIHLEGATTTPARQILQERARRLGPDRPDLQEPQ